MLVDADSELMDSGSEITAKNLEGALDSDQWTEVSAPSEQSGTDHSSYVRKSQRKRKPNSRLGEYITAKTPRIDSGRQVERVKVSWSAGALCSEWGLR